MASLPELKLDNPFWTFMGKLGDLVLLNLLWLLTCLPIVTIGSATTALHYVARKIAAGETYRVFGDFLFSFRENWKEATKLWLAMLGVLILSAADFISGLLTAGAAGSLFRGIGICLIVLWLLTAGYCFPMLARYRQSAKQIFLLSFSMMLRSPAVTVCYALLAALMPVLFFAAPELFAWLLFPWALIFGALYAWLMAFLLIPLQRKLEQNGGNDHVDTETETGL